MVSSMYGSYRTLEEIAADMLLFLKLEFLKPFVCCLLLLAPGELGAPAKLVLYAVELHRYITQINECHCEP